MIASLWKNNNIILILILMHQDQKKINKANCLSSIPGKDGAAEFWHWDSITYVGNFLIKLLLIIINNITTTTTTIIINTIVRMIATTFAIWQNSSSSAI